MVSRRSTLVSLGAALSIGIAGCSESPDEQTQSTPTETETGQTESTASDIPGPDEATLVPNIDALSYGLFDTRTVQEDVDYLDGGTITGFSNASEWTFPHVEFTHQDVTELYDESRYQSPFHTENRYFLEPDTETEVGAPGDDEVAEVKRVYREGYYPPSEPYYGLPDYDERPIISGTETEQGIEFEISSLDGELRDVRTKPDAHIIDGYDNVITEGSKLEIPWARVERNYLSRPLHPVVVETLESQKEVLLEPPTPEVSVETTLDVTDQDEHIRVNRITFDVTFDSQKPTQYASAYAKLDYTVFSTMRADPTKEGQVPIEGSGTIELEGGTVPVPLDDTNMDLMVMQNAPLYVEHPDVTKFL